MNRSMLMLAAAVLAVPAVAQVAPSAPAAPMTMRHGAMADGAMTLPELQTRIATMFARKDANKDGALTADEMARKGGMKRMAWTGKDGEKVMMREGPMADPKAAFDRLDANKDGMISRDEFAKGREMRIERRVEMKDGAGSAMRQPRGMRMRMGGGMMGGKLFAMADTNKDGRVLLAEAQATAAQHFAMADTNRDGKVTHDEMHAMHMKMMPAHGEHMNHAG